MPVTRDTGEEMRTVGVENDALELAALELTKAMTRVFLVSCRRRARTNDRPVNTVSVVFVVVLAGVLVASRLPSQGKSGVTTAKVVVAIFTLVILDVFVTRFTPVSVVSTTAMRFTLRTTAARHSPGKSLGAKPALVFDFACTRCNSVAKLIL